MPFLYWLVEGSPDRMDADRDGIPCESTGFEDELWGIERVAQTASGMPCDELANSERFEHDYYGAVLSWLYHGRPAELDPDSDGLPCHPGWGRSWSLQDVKWFTDGLPGYTNAC